MIPGPVGNGGNSTLSPVLVHVFAYSLLNSSSISLASSGSSLNGNPYLHSEKSVAGVKYSLSQSGANVFLTRLDVLVEAALPNFDDAPLAKSLT